MSITEQKFRPAFEMSTKERKEYLNWLINPMPNTENPQPIDPGDVRRQVEDWNRLLQARKTQAEESGSPETPALDLDEEPFDPKKHTGAEARRRIAEMKRYPTAGSGALKYRPEAHAVSSQPLSPGQNPVIAAINIPMAEDVLDAGTRIRPPEPQKGFWRTPVGKAILPIGLALGFAGGAVAAGAISKGGRNSEDPGGVGAVPTHEPTETDTPEPTTEPSVAPTETDQPPTATDKPEPSETSKPTVESITLPEGDVVYEETREDGGKFIIVNNNPHFDGMRLVNGGGPFTSEEGANFRNGLIDQAFEALGEDRTLPEFWAQKGEVTLNSNVIIQIVGFEAMPQVMQDYQRTGQLPDSIFTVDDMLEQTKWVEGQSSGGEKGLFSFFNMEIDNQGKTILRIATNGFPEKFYESNEAKGVSRELYASHALSSNIFDILSDFREVVKARGKAFPAVEGVHPWNLNDPPGNIDDFFSREAEEYKKLDFEFSVLPVLQ